MWQPYPLWHSQRGVQKLPEPDPSQHPHHKAVNCQSKHELKWIPWSVTFIINNTDWEFYSNITHCGPLIPYAMVSYTMQWCHRSWLSLVLKQWWLIDNRACHWQPLLELLYPGTPPWCTLVNYIYVWSLDRSSTHYIYVKSVDRSNTHKWNL